mmetsp:Transcript_44664/g.77294  ORF Transcript_44664/g.77294 Transcript_44664/m.77294 type:complete len:281 (-) Transcript_44664:387-1229(-)
MGFLYCLYMVLLFVICPDSLGTMLATLVFILWAIAVHIFTLQSKPVHHGLQLRLLALGDGLGGHLHLQCAVEAHNCLAHRLNGLGQQGDAKVLVQGGACEHIHGRGDEADLDGRTAAPAAAPAALLGLHRLARGQRRAHRLHPLVGEAGHLHVRADLDGLRRELAADVGRQLRLLGLRHLQALKHPVLRERELEGVVGVARPAVQRPAAAAVQVLQRRALLVRHVPQHAVHRFGFVVAVLAFGDILGRYPPLAQVDVPFFFIHSENHNDLVSIHPDQFVD